MSVNRFRYGATFALAGSYPGGTTFAMRLICNGFSQTMEAVTPQLYLSNSLDAPLYGGDQFGQPQSKPLLNWEENLDTFLGSYNNVQLQQDLSISAASLSPFLGTFASFVLVSQLESLGMGATGAAIPGIGANSVIVAPRLVLVVRYA